MSVLHMSSYSFDSACHVMVWLIYVLLCHEAAFINTTPDAPMPNMRTFVDGGLIANNPTIQVTTQPAAPAVAACAGCC